MRVIRFVNLVRSVRHKAVCSILLLAPLLIIGGLIIGGCSHHGAEISHWESSGKLFRIRITEYEEKGVYFAGAYYVFEAASQGSGDWREIMTVKHDDRPDIPRDQVRFVNDQVAYCFMVYQYAVTTDGGKTWTVWDIRKELPGWNMRRAAIRDVRLESSGNGSMELQPFSGWQTEKPVLHTLDFGRHWSE